MLSKSVTAVFGKRVSSIFFGGSVSLHDKPQEKVLFRDRTGKQVEFALSAETVSCIVGGVYKIPEVKELHLEWRTICPNGMRWLSPWTRLELKEDQEDVVDRVFDIFRKSHRGKALAGTGLLLDVSIHSAKLGPAMDGSKLKKLTCSCGYRGMREEIRTRPASAANHHKRVDWRYRGMIGGYEPGDVLEFVIHNNNQVVGVAELVLAQVELPKFQGELCLQSKNPSARNFMKDTLLRVEVTTGSARERLQQSALKRLADAVDRGVTSEIEEAIREAMEIGVPASACGEASAKLRSVWGDEARLCLQEGVAQRRPSLVDKSERLARLAGLPESEYVETIERFRKLRTVENSLTCALQSRKVESLREAIDLGHRANVPEKILLEPRVLLELLEALSSAHVGKLKLALESAEKAGLHLPEGTEAAKMLRNIELRSAREMLIRAAAEPLCAAELSAAIAAARAAGLPESEYSGLIEIFKEVDRREKLRPVLSDLEALCDATQNMDMEDFDTLATTKDRFGSMLKCARDLNASNGELERAEEKRKQIHNKVLDLQGCIRVFCRVRPLSQNEADQGDYDITQELDLMTIQVESVRNDVTGMPKSTNHTFNVDAVFRPGTQEDIFKDCSQLMRSAVEGHNVTIMAYGQTGAGKTYTMAGSGEPGMEGISQRTIQQLFDLMRQGTAHFEYVVMASVVELYLSEAYDLLSDTRAPLPLRYREGSFWLEGLVEFPCETAEELAKVLDRGQEMRVVAQTRMNTDSSRSHLLFTISLRSTHRATGQAVTSKIVLVDLAGSERLTKYRSSGIHEREAIEINKSLTALGDVIYAVTQENPIVPYRNHKLTQLLQDSLGGTAKAVMIINCSPASSNCEETLSSLNFAVRAKSITNELKMNIMRLQNIGVCSARGGQEKTVLALDLSSPPTSATFPKRNARKSTKKRTASICRKDLAVSESSPSSRATSGASPTLGPSPSLATTMDTLQMTSSTSGPLSPPGTAKPFSVEGMAEELARERQRIYELERSNAELRHALEQQTSTSAAVVPLPTSSAP